MNDITKKIISLLFYTGDSFSISKLADLLEVSESDIEDSLEGIHEFLRQAGLSLNRLDNNISLTTHPDTTDLITKIRQEELQGSLSPAALETLALILYRNPIKKTDIDYIRGVNSQFILRNLHSKGLVSREKDPDDERSHVYKPTLALMEFLGIKSIEDLPDYKTLREELSLKEEILHSEDND